ncbi:MAG: phosphate ABC transporter permease subunit PstC [Verrucomicrobiales bacterium]|nr:phosphate ABC transporter permease subunit PstC [Verrucomicrobiales bacterium]
MIFDKKREGFRFLGLGKQEFIKYFFGGNASLAVFILVLICAFLLKEAWLFFPSHHEQLKTYRKSGLEYFTWVEDAYQKYKISTGALNRAFQAELAYPNRHNQELMSAYEATRIFAERELGDSLLILRDAIKQRKSESSESSDRAAKLDSVIESLKKKIDARRPELRKKIVTTNILGIRIKKPRVPELQPLSQEDRNKVVDAVVNHNFWERGDAEFYEEIEEKYDDVWDIAAESAKPLEDIFNTFRTDIAAPLDAIWREASEHTRTTRDRSNSNEIVPRQIEGQINVALASKEPSIRQIKYGAVLQVIADAEYFDEYARIFYLFRFTEAIFELKPDGRAYDELPEATREKVEGIINSVSGNYADFVEVLRTGGDELDSFPKAVPAGTMDPDMRSLLFDLTRFERGSDKMIRELADEAGSFVKAFPFDKEARKIYDLTERYETAIIEMKEKGRAAIREFPDPATLQTESARTELAAFRETFEKDIAELQRVGEKLRDWKFNEPWGWTETAGAFFLGKKWTNNSQIQDRYGILPMFTGSLIISVIALVIAVPISIASAIYVNQIASFKEQNFLKPCIEFIGAIPSVVLGFLGIVVVGQMIKVASNWPIFSWLPGFPIDARLNMLTAGLLLAFMAVPIIFTLAEDALNNVPSDYRDGALSLGATRLQAAFRVILPASLSGVIAAVLLGFGRVIGETMVVLLVAGNRIAIPDFSKGIGVVTEPSHTMTGIIAQSLGEAAKDSVDYRALFMVGLVLFFITLLINFIGQKILTKYQTY